MVLAKTRFEEETLDLDAETIDLEGSATKGADEVAAKHSLDSAPILAADLVASPITIVCYDAELNDGSNILGWKSEVWWREKDVLTIIRTCAPAGEYLVTRHSGPEDRYAHWFAGEYNTGWTSEVVLVVTKAADGGLHVAEVEDLERLAESEYRYNDELSALSGVFR